MIVGNGLIARSFINKLEHDAYVIFASGVSNSSETDKKKFNRESELLNNIIYQNPKKKLIYFTSVLDDSDSPYYNHKKEMESLIKNLCENFIIYRIPQIIGPIGNRLNLVNAVTDSIRNGNVITVYDEIKRSIIDIDDLIDIVNYSIEFFINDYVNISYIESMTVIEIVQLISDILKIKAKIQTISGKGSFENWNLENSRIVIDWINKNKIQTHGYTNTILRKYL